MTDLQACQIEVEKDSDTRKKAHILGLTGRSSCVNYQGDTERLARRDLNVVLYKHGNAKFKRPVMDSSFRRVTVRRFRIDEASSLSGGNIAPLGK